MSDKPSLFRERALARAGDPEALDILPLQPKTLDWAALVLLSALAAATVTWGVFGTVTRSISGNGILIARGGQLIEAQSSGPGQIVALAVRPGARIEAGGLIATVVAPDREQRLASAHALVDIRKTNLRRVQRSMARLIQQQEAAAAQQREALESKLAVARERIQITTNQFEIQDSLFRRGLTTLQRVNDSRDTLNASRLDEVNTLTALADLKSKQIEEARTYADRIAQAEDDVSAAERSEADLGADLALSSRVLAPVPGRVVEVKANPGAFVNAGQAIVSIETGSAGLELLAFIPSQKAREVVAGMSVRVSPAGTRREEHGELLGIVRDMSSFPVSGTGLRSLLQNETLAENVSRAGAPYVARVELVERTDAPGSYSWTTREGAKVALSSGGLAAIEVAVSEHRPIELVMPAVRKLLGL